LSQSTRVTDGQTGRRTDRILIARPRLHCMQRGKNVTICDRFVLFWRWNGVGGLCFEGDN